MLPLDKDEQQLFKQIDDNGYDGREVKKYLLVALGEIKQERRIHNAITGAIEKNFKPENLVLEGALALECAIEHLCRVHPGLNKPKEGLKSYLKVRLCLKKDHAEYKNANSKYTKLCKMQQILIQCGMREVTFYTALHFALKDDQIRKKVCVRSPAYKLHIVDSKNCWQEVACKTEAEMCSCIEKSEAFFKGMNQKAKELVAKAIEMSRDKFKEEMANIE